MKQIFHKNLPLISMIITAVLLVSCSMPTEENDAAAQQTAVAETVEASLATVETIEEPTAPAATATTALTEVSTQTPAVTETPEEEVVGEDRAEFIADVTIQDYSEQQVEDEITKTWRIRNIGESTWTSDYYLEFEKGEQMGADGQVFLTEEVPPNDYIDLSVDFTVPATAGEYASYWRLRNADDQLVGIDEEDTPLSLYMVIMAVEEGDGDSGDGGDDGGSSSSGGISGGATIAGATVSVDDASYSGSCPGQVTFTYTVTTSTAGNVQFYLSLTPTSPSGYTFDATPEYDINFSGGYTVTYTYTLFSNSSVSATAKVIAVGEDTYSSSPINFSINCN